MKTYLLLILLIFKEANGMPAKKGPAFSTPVYSDSYLPAAMQVIFYAVEQLKALQVEEAEQTTITPTTVIATTILTIPTTISHKPGQQQPETTTPSIEETSTEKPALSQEASIVETENSNDNPSTPSSDNEMPEMGEETPEVNYGTPETNHEIPEESHEKQEVNQETPQPEKDITLADYSKDKLADPVSTASISDETHQSNKPNSSSVSSSSSASSSSSEEDSSEEDKDEKKNDKKKEPTVDSVVQEIYGIMKPQNKIKNPEESESNESRESSDESDEEENEENRFTLLGEKVTQVPRPSLSTYLKRSKIPPKCSLQQLALLYDALSKDARKQGFAKFSGYSDEVLKTLKTSAEGGIGPQLQKLLEKILERNDVTRDDAKTKVTAMLKELKEPASEINKDLRSLLPLRFNP